MLWFDGKQVAAWIVPILQRARDSGMWKGVVTSGYRSWAKQALLYYGAPGNGLIRGVTVARPGASNHNFHDWPRGAVDVSDYNGLHRYIHAHDTNLKSYMDVLGPRDPVHFSATGH